jgi:tripartite ATP-independent transporter DctM subunit
VLSILGTIYTGIATPTESAAIGATCAILIALWHRRLTVKILHQALLRTTGTTAMIMFLVIGGNSLAFLLSSLTIPQYLTEAIVGMSLGKWTVMIMINIVLLILGCLLDPMAIMVISLPILFPIVTNLGFDPLWFGIIVTMNVEVGMITPPVGLNLFILKGAVRDIDMRDIVGGAVPFVMLMIIGMALISVFPAIATWLPYRMGF